MKNFKIEEFACKCGCGLNNMDQGLLDMLDHARDVADVPFVINSGTRCLKHNEAVGGSTTSSHLLGYAADVATPDSTARFKIMRALLLVGIKVIGINLKKNFYHVSNDPNKGIEIIFPY